MKSLPDIKVFAFKHFEKLIACAASGLFAASMIQSIGTMSFNETSETDISLSTLDFERFMAGANSRDIIYEDVIYPSKAEIKTAGQYNKESVKSNSAETEKVTGSERASAISVDFSEKNENTYYKISESKKKISSSTKNKKESTLIKRDIKKTSVKSSKEKDKKKAKKHSYEKTGNVVKDRLNSAELNPKEFLKGKDEKILKKHLNKIIDDDMSNYQKAKACYDYIINNTYYSYGGWGNAIESVLENGYGTCTEYSYVYMAMMKYLGFDAKTVDGSTAMAAGGYSYHMWVEVKLNGKTYVFDPQVEDDMTNGRINYYRFCKTYSEVSGSYIK